MPNTPDHRLTDIERALLDALLTGEHVVLKQLRAQENIVTVKERHWSSVGCTAEIHVPRTSPPVRPATINLADVGFKLRGAENPGHAILFVNDGFLSAIEYYNWTDDWPENAELESVHFYSPYAAKHPEPSQKRDLDGLAKDLAA
jgi:hypothetical protein